MWWPVLRCIKNMISCLSRGECFSVLCLPFLNVISLVACEGNSLFVWNSSEPSLCNSASSSLASLHPGGHPADAFSRGLSQIYEDSEPGTRPTTKAGDSQSWAVTQLRKVGTPINEIYPSESSGLELSVILLQQLLLTV